MVRCLRPLVDIDLVQIRVQRIHDFELAWPSDTDVQRFGARDIDLFHPAHGSGRSVKGRTK